MSAVTFCIRCRSILQKEFEYGTQTLSIAKNRVFAGVAGGLGEYFDIDPVFIRVIFVVATLAGASGLLAYIILWIVVPKERLLYATNTTTTEGVTNMSEGSSGEKQNPGYGYRHHKHNGSVMGGIILIVIGGLFLADNYLPHFRFGRHGL